VSTRRTTRGESRSEQLRRAAADLFLARGYDGVSLDEIVRVAGGSKANIYSFFGGKQGLFLAAVEELCDELLAPLTLIDIGADEFVATFRRTARTILDIMLNDRAVALYRIVVAAAPHCPAAARLWFASAPARAHKVLAAVLERKQQADGMSLDDCHQAAVLFHDMLTLRMHFEKLLGLREAHTAGELDAQVEAAVALFLQGFAASGSRALP
jgi:AcrR family transcriptional regulator